MTGTKTRKPKRKAQFWYSGSHCLGKSCLFPSHPTHGCLISTGTRNLAACWEIFAMPTSAEQSVKSWPTCLLRVVLVLSDKRDSPQNLPCLITAIYLQTFPA